MPRNTTYDFSPVTDADYERSRAISMATALECSTDGRLPPEIAERIWQLRHSNVTLPPALEGELYRDLLIARGQSRQFWRMMKVDIRRARDVWAQFHASVAKPDQDWFSQQALKLEDAAVERARTWRDWRKMVAYLERRLAAMASVAMADAAE